jgi:S1-C subfamily serine protease
MNRKTLLFIVIFIGGFLSGLLLLRQSEPVPLKGLTVPSQKRMKSVKRLRDPKDPRITPVVLAAQKAAPSVVNIQVGHLIQTRRGKLFQKRAEGSGVIVDSSGLTITNWHVVHESAIRSDFYAQVTLRDGRVFPAKVLSSSRLNDLALLLLQQPKGKKKVLFPPIEMGDSDDLMIGETVLAIGNPRGQANSVTAGVLSAINRTELVLPPGEMRARKVTGLLQTDAAINPGNSGGALLDIRGRLIGINSMMQKESENIGFAIPVNKVKEVFVQELLSFDNFDRFWTGLKITHKGKELLVNGVESGGPAALAGIRRGDLIRKIGNRSVQDMKDLTKILITFEANQEIPLEIERNNKKIVRKLIPWDRDKARLFWLSGILAKPVDPKTDRETFIKAYREVENLVGSVRFTPLQVIMVQKGSKAQELGIVPGDVLVGIKYYNFWDQEYVRVFQRGISDFVRQASQNRGRSLRILIYRRGKGILGGDLEIR